MARYILTMSNEFPAAAYDAWKTTPDEEQEVSGLDCYHPGRPCGSRCDPNNDGDDERNGDNEREDW